MDVSVFDGSGTGGTVLFNQTVSDATPTSGSSLPDASVFSAFTFMFTAQGPSTTIHFADTSEAQSGPGGFDAMLDNVSVTAVPEPGANVFLLVSCLGWFGFKKRRVRA